MSYVQSLYHIVFSTYRREPTIATEHSQELYAVIANIINGKNCKALLVNGVQNHIHMLISLHPTVALADIMRELKSRSSLWMKQSGKFPLFCGWEHEYGAFSLSYGHRQAVYDYIAAQREHHASASLDDEYERLILKAGLTMFRS